MVLRRISILALLLALAVAAAPASGAPTAGTQRLSGMEQAVVREINRVRVASDLRPLTLAPGLQSAAVSHTRAMLQGGFFEHELPGGRPFGERLRRTYPPRDGEAWFVGENLFAMNAEPTPQEVVDAWLGSPPHRDILLSMSFREVGVAVLRTPHAGGAFGNQATWAVTADFGARGGPASHSTS